MHAFHPTTAAKRVKPASPPLFYRPAELARKLSVGRTTLYDWERDGKMPRRINLAPGVAGWLADDIHSWLEAKSSSVEGSQ